MTSLHDTNPTEKGLGRLSPSGIVRSLDFPLTTILIIFAGLAWLAPSQVMPSARFTWDAFLSILPFLVLSVGLAGALKASGADQIVAKAFEGRPVQAIALASLFGALSPFCSCGVVPIVA